jgi:endonuclease III
LERLTVEYPDPRCALVHDDTFQLLVATILSAQSTDEMVNKVTPALFARYPTAADLADADPDEVETLIHSTGFFRSKTKSLMGMAAALEERFDGQVPRDLEDLVTLPGVGRKTGNVVRSVGYDLPGLPVDTHVGRLARRLRLTKEADPAGSRGGSGPLLAAAHRARPPGLSGPPTPLRRLPPGRRLPQRVQSVSRAMARSNDRPAPISSRSAANSSAAIAESGVSS